MTYRFEIQGLQAAQQATIKTVRAIKPENGLGRAVKFLALGAQARLISQTHVDTGALRASELIIADGPAQYTIYNSPSARNPRSRALVTSYAQIEENRGGDHAAWLNTFNYARSSLAPRAVTLLISELA